MKYSSKFLFYLIITVLSSIALFAQISDTKISAGPGEAKPKAQVANIGRKGYAFELEDQFKSLHRWFQYGAKPQILVVSDRVGFEFLDNWAVPLKENFETKGVIIHSIVSLADIKPFMKGYFRKQFKDKYTNPIMLDWDNKVFNYYKCQPNLANVIYLDSTKTVKYQIAGNGVVEQVRDAINQIEKTLANKSEKK